MKKAIIGKKVGMTQIFDEAGKVIPVTVIEAGPCTVVSKMTKDKEGYDAVQFGYEEVAEKKLSKPEAGHLKKAGVGMVTKLFADRLAGEGIPVFEIRPGIIDTDMTKVAHEKYQRLIEGGLLPVKRFGTPLDVAKMALACAEGLLDYSAGQVLDADGGFSLQRL